MWYHSWGQVNDSGLDDLHFGIRNILYISTLRHHVRLLPLNLSLFLNRMSAGRKRRPWTDLLRVVWVIGRAPTLPA